MRALLPPPCPLALVLRDRLASTISIADTTGALLNHLDLGTVAAFQAVTADGTLYDAYMELARRVEVFDVLVDKVRKISDETESGEDQSTMDIWMATMACLWASLCSKKKTSGPP